MTTHGAPELPGLALARLFHETYERLAPQFGCTTRPETREFDPESANGKLMIAVCAAIQQAAGAVPEGWKLVPVEPTLDMLEAGKQAHYEAENKISEPGAWEINGFANRKIRAAHIFRAVIDASPSPLGREAACVSQNAESEPQTNLTRTDDPQREAGSSDHLVPCAGGGVTQPLTDAPRWQVGTWTLTAPDGRTWQADSPLKACSAEQRERIPPEVALKRIFDALDDGGTLK